MKNPSHHPQYEVAQYWLKNSSVLKCRIASIELTRGMTQYVHHMYTISMGYSQRGSNFWPLGCPSGLLYHGLLAAIKQILEMCLLIPMDQLCPVDEVYAPIGPVFLSGWRFCAWNILQSSDYRVPTSHGYDFNRFQLILLVGIPRPSGTRQYQYGPGFDQNTTAFIN